MKKMCIYTCFLAVFMLLPCVAAIPVSAYENSYENEIRDILDISADGDYITKEEADGDSDIDIFDKIIKILSDSVKSLYKNAAKTFTLIVSVLGVSVIMKSFSEVSHGFSKVMDYVSVLALSGVVFYAVNGVLKFASEAIENLCIYVTSFLPVSATLYAMSGYTGTGIASSSALMIFLSVIEYISSKFIYPLIIGGFVLSLASALPGAGEMRSITAFVKSMLNTVMGLSFAIFGVVMYFQTAITASADSYAFRSVRFLASSFIPIIGSVIGDSARTVSAAVGTVKATSGAVGLVIVFSIILPPVIFTLMYKFAFLFSGMICRLLGLENESRLLYDTNAYFGVLVALLSGTSAVFVLALAIFIKTNG